MTRLYFIKNTSVMFHCNNYQYEVFKKLNDANKTDMAYKYYFYLMDKKNKRLEAKGLL